MISNRNLFLLFLGIAAAASAVYFGWFRDHDKAPVEYERSFGVKDPDEIAQIFMADKHGHSVKLNRKGQQWYMDDTVLVRQGPIDLILETIGKLRIKYVPTKASLKTIIDELATNATKVELYNREGVKFKSWYMGGTPPNGIGTYAIMENAENPYVIEIPGFVGNVNVRFFLDKNEWRDRTVFAWPADSIREVIVEYPGQRSESFKLTQEKGSYRVDPLFPTTPVSTKPLIPGNAEAFLYGFESQIAEAILLPDAPEIQGIEQKKAPFAVIQAISVQGTTRAVKLYPMDDSPVVEGDTLLDNTKVERYHAVSNWGSVYLVQLLNFKKILWGYPYFFEKMNAGVDPLYN